MATLSQIIVPNNITTATNTQTLTNKTLTAPTINAATLTGIVLQTSANGLGYGTGAGGTVTQATDKTTAVTLNKPTGQVTTAASALAANTAVSFSVNNSNVAATDIVTISTASAGAAYRIEVQRVSAGAFSIRITNITAGSLSDAITFSFAVIKAVTA